MRITYEDLVIRAEAGEVIIYDPNKRTTWKFDLKGALQQLDNKINHNDVLNDFIVNLTKREGFTGYDLIIETFNQTFIQNIPLMTPEQPGVISEEIIKSYITTEIDDSITATNKTWSSEKISQTFNNLGSSLTRHILQPAKLNDVLGAANTFTKNQIEDFSNTLNNTLLFDDYGNIGYITSISGDTVLATTIAIDTDTKIAKPIGTISTSAPANPVIGHYWYNTNIIGAPPATITSSISQWDGTTWQPIASYTASDWDLWVNLNDNSLWIYVNGSWLPLNFNMDLSAYRTAVNQDLIDTTKWTAKPPSAINNALSDTIGEISSPPAGTTGRQVGDLVYDEQGRLGQIVALGDRGVIQVATIAKDYKGTALDNIRFINANEIGEGTGEFSLVEKQPDDATTTYVLYLTEDKIRGYLYQLSDCTGGSYVWIYKNTETGKWQMNNNQWKPVRDGSGGGGNARLRLRLNNELLDPPYSPAGQDVDINIPIDPFDLTGGGDLVNRAVKIALSDNNTTKPAWADYVATARTISGNAYFIIEWDWIKNAQLILIGNGNGTQNAGNIAINHLVDNIYRLFYIMPYHNALNNKHIYFTKNIDTTLNSSGSTSDVGSNLGFWTTLSNGKILFDSARALATY